MDDRVTSRRRFLQVLGAGSMLAIDPLGVLGGLAPVTDVTNPLEYYPSRDWEKARSTA